MKNHGTQEASYNATPQETENTMWPVIEIGGGFSSVTPPKTHQTQDVHGHMHGKSQDSPPPAACVVCGKQFPNKKSLGGHMNMHPERPWRGPVCSTNCTMWPVIEIGGGSSSVTPHRDQQTQDVHGGHGGSQDPPAACVVCGKQFPNKKSIGGHMSMHPERPWRGLYPPETRQSSVSSARDGGTTALASMQIDLNQPAPEE
ncbi:putative transcription factor C2H2 family [Fagus crenata]